MTELLCDTTPAVTYRFVALLPRGCNKISLEKSYVRIEEYKVHVCVERENCCLIRLVTLVAAVVDSTY